MVLGALCLFPTLLFEKVENAFSDVEDFIQKLVAIVKASLLTERSRLLAQNCPLPVLKECLNQH